MSRRRTFVDFTDRVESNSQSSRVEGVDTDVVMNELLAANTPEGYLDMRDWQVGKTRRVCRNQKARIKRAIEDIFLRKLPRNKEIRVKVTTDDHDNIFVETTITSIY